MNYPYIYRGSVLLNDDPKNLGRCKVLVPSIHGSTNITPNLLPWSRPIANLSVNSNSGSYCIPEVGDIVWVFFEGGDIDSPVYIGGSFGVNDIPIRKDEVMIYRNGNDVILYNKESKTFSVNVGGSTLDIAGDSISIYSGTVNIKSGNIRLDSNVQITGNLNLQGNLNISGSCNRECECSHE